MAQSNTKIMRTSFLRLIFVTTLYFLWCAPANAEPVEKLEKGRLQFCVAEGSAGAQQGIEILADGKYLIDGAKFGLKEPIVVKQTDFLSSLDASSQAQQNSTLVDRFRVENRDGKLVVHLDTKYSPCLYLNAEAPSLGRDDLTFSGSQVAPDWSSGAEGGDFKGFSFRYFSSLDQTYYIASEVGKRLSFVVHDSQLGSNLSHDRVDRETVTNPKVLALVPNAVKLRLLGLNAIDSNVVDLAKYNIDVQDLDLQNAAEVTALSAQFTKAVRPPPHSRLVLVLPARSQIRMKFSNTMLLGSKVEGLAFYRDSNIVSTSNTQVVPIVAFASFQAAVIDVDSSKLMIAKSYSDGVLFNGPLAPEVDLVDTITDHNKFTALTTVVTVAVARVINEMFDAR
jgi:hypothetical protein